MLTGYDAYLLTYFDLLAQLEDLIAYRIKRASKNEGLEGFAAIAAQDQKEPLRTISQFGNWLSKSKIPSWKK